MEFETPLEEGILLQRYKRFLADVRRPDGEEFTIHTPNTGSMRGCSEPGSRIWFRDAGNPRRRYRHTWEITETPEGARIGVNTSRSNALVREAIETGQVPELAGYPVIRPEVPLGESRIDFALEGGERPCFVEVKNVTLAEAGVARFPDAVSKRGSRHLDELARAVADGARGVILYCIQREDAESMRPADDIDPAYGEALRRAVAGGVEALALRASITLEGITLDTPVPVHAGTAGEAA